ncbi:U3 small nucleolar RNA-associated protein 22 [Ceratocystis lukuohia]|uniref:U3 small nucleolar RNA-associated protein 22 n=1 Tax=Ceratocystis lukuohia TaxID=2019550 RepID=A0ABR4MP56_9PEZI
MESNPKRLKTSHSGGFNADLKMAARLTTASTFVLETEELLKNAKLDYGKAFPGADALLFKAKSAIESLESSEPEKIGPATKRFEKKHKITVPFPDPRPAEDLPYLVSFIKPSKINVVGSYVMRSMVRGSQATPAIDMVIEMPKEMFQDKDYMNMRYFYRRAFFVAHLAHAIKSTMSADATVHFEFLHQNELLPVLVVRIIKKDDSDDGAINEQAAGQTATQFEDYVIRIIPCAPVGLLSKDKLVPSRCNNKQGVSEEKRETSLSATPFYNNTLKAEETFISYLRVLTVAKKECAGFADACLLGRVWLKQRGFGSSISDGGFGTFEWSLMLALLLKAGGSGKKAKKGGLSTALSSTELFKAAMQFLSIADFANTAFVFGGASKAGVADEAVEDGPVLYDPERQLNIAFKMSGWSAGLLRLHAKSTYEVLGNPALAQFESTFIVKANVPAQLFDAVFQVAISSSTPLTTKLKTATDRRGIAWGASNEAYKVLEKAYGNRTQLVHIGWKPRESWGVSERPAKVGSQTLSVGLIFDATHVSRVMDLGPPAEEQEEALNFRSFWGSRSELRRFKDGSILECVPWEKQAPVELVVEIATVVFKRHLKLDPESIKLLDSGMDQVLALSPMDKTSFDMAKRAFVAFEQDIRGLEGMPLHVRRLSPISPALRYASQSIPELRGFFTGPIKPMEVLLYFEASGKWPENLVAIQEAKIEFLLDIHKRLTATKEGVSAYLGRENVEQGISNMAYLDVVYSTGAAFRLRIVSEMEETLLQRQVKNKTLETPIRIAAETALSGIKFLYETLPLHTQTIATACTRLPALSGSIRMVKHWFACQKLTSYFSEELLELFTLHAFLESAPWCMPSSASTGFLRTMSFLARWDWRDEPLIVDTEGEGGAMSLAERTALRESLATWRSRDPGLKSLVLFVATPHDSSGHSYTRNGPSKMAAARMTRLAKAACKIARTKEDSLGFLTPQQVAAIFEAPLQDYDVLLHLSTRAINTILKTIGGSSAVGPSALPSAATAQFKNLGLSVPGSSIPLPMTRYPVDVLVAELRKAYGDSMAFFIGGESDDVIGAIWTAKAKDVTQTFRVGLPYNFVVPSGEEEHTVELNKKAILLEIARIGGEMIRKIDVVET